MVRASKEGWPPFRSALTDANFSVECKNTCASQPPLQLTPCQTSNPRNSPNRLSVQGLDWTGLGDLDLASALTLKESEPTVLRTATAHPSLALVRSPVHCRQGRAASPLAITDERLLLPSRPPLSRLVSNRFPFFATRFTSRLRRRSPCLASPSPQPPLRNHTQCLSQSN